MGSWRDVKTWRTSVGESQSLWWSFLGIWGEEEEEEGGF